MKKIFALLLFSLMQVETASACRYMPNASELEGALADREQMRELVVQFAEDADRIFIGTVRSLSKVSATFYDIVNLKGQTTEGITLEWSVPKEIVVGCGGLTTFMNLQTPEEGEMMAYLVYAKGNRLLRTNEVGSFSKKPSGYEELEWLKVSHHITN